MRKHKLNIWWRLVWLSVVVPTVLSNEHTACHGLFLQLYCNSTTVISVVWDATFFGRSSCINFGACCPKPADCTVLVEDSNSTPAWVAHWKELNDCNGNTSCTVQAFHSSTCQSTNYETVTYDCVTPEATTTPQDSSTIASSLTPTSIGSVSISDGAVYSSTSQKASSPDESLTTLSTRPQSSTQGSASSGESIVTSTASPTVSVIATQPNNDEGTRSPDGESESTNDMLGIIIAVVVAAVFMLIVVAAVTILIYCRRKKKAAANDKEAAVEDDIIKRPDRTYSTPGKQPLCDENGYDPLGTNSPAVSADTLSKPVTFGPLNGDCYAEPQKLRPTETSTKPVGSSLYSQPADAKLVGENPEEDYSYAYSQFRGQNEASRGSENRAAEGKGSVIYADIMHQQNEEYLEDDDTILTENSLYKATVDTQPGQEAEDVGNYDGDGDDMMITDNDLYEMNEGDSSHQQQDQREEDDDDEGGDMILTENDLYSAT